MGSETGNPFCTGNGARDAFPYDEVEYRLKRGWASQKEMTEADKCEWLESVLGPSESVEITNG